MVTYTDEERRSWYKRYAEDNKERIAWKSQQRREVWRKKLLEIVGGSKCKDCGNTDYRVLQFDHLRDKISNVSRYLDRNWSKALEEAEKCEVVCANCHVIREYERRPKHEEVPTKKSLEALCPNGHPRNKENRIPVRGGSTTICRECNRQNSRNYMREKRKKERNGTN